MPAGLKSTSSTVTIGFSVDEIAPNTFAQSQIDLNLSPLDREVFVVQAIDLTLQSPDALAGIDTAAAGSLTTTRRVAVAELDDSNCLAVAVNQIRAAGFVDGGVGFSQTAGESPNTLLEYVGIIATNDFFVQCIGAGNLSLMRMTGKLYGYRATASADIFAALVQSEVLSA